MLLTFILALIGLMICEAHVSLQFPKARDYPTDFLVNVVTREPCGMPKGEVKTTLLQGSTINITWYLGYPHPGGYRLDLLDQEENHLAYLTSQGEEFITDKTTDYVSEVSIPDDLECMGCVVRLMRQATEYGPSFFFYSCADVDIVPERLFTQTCGGHGKYLDDKCTCDQRFSGKFCEFEDECFNDNDCGSGKCIDLETTSSPRKVCFCTNGYFGIKCAQRSFIRRENQVNLEALQSRQLSDEVTLHWRVLKEEEEIEVALVNKGINFVGLGWRPTSETPECRNFPNLDDLASAKQVLITESESKPEAETSPERASRSDGDVSPAAEPVPQGNSGKKPTPVDEPDVERVQGGNSEPEVKTEVEPKSTNIGKTLQSEADSENGISITEGKNPTGSANSIGSSSSKPASTNSDGNMVLVRNNPSFSLNLKLGLQVNAGAFDMMAMNKSDLPEQLSNDRLVNSPTKRRRSRRSATYRNDPEAASKSENEPKTSSRLTKDALWYDGPLHPMDCTDIVIGMTRGNLYRILDYYTRDRSTPRPDDFFGGENSLTAAIGWERDGVSTVYFRKKLIATHTTDNNITDGPMHVIWSRGQDVNMYSYMPDNFFLPDDLKYHGSIGQRQAISHDFYGENI